LAAGEPPPPERDWRQLEIEPRRVDAKSADRARDPEFSFGVWRTLAWLLGVREDWPVYTSWHKAAGLPVPYPHHYVPPAMRDAAWHAADAAARDQARTEAQLWWAHVRRLADNTA
jgi:hypothetical protein